MRNITLAKFLWNSRRSPFHTKQLSKVFSHVKSLVMWIPFEMTDLAHENLQNTCKCDHTLMVNTSIQKVIVSL